MRSVACALYILLTALTSFQISAHDGAATRDQEFFVEGRITQREGRLFITFHFIDDRTAEYEISPDHRYFKDQNVWASGTAERNGYFTVKSLITKPNTWIGKGVGQGLLLQGRVVPRPNGGLDFYPVQPRALQLLGGKKSVQLIFPPDMHPSDIYSHLVQVRGVLTEEKLILDPLYGSFQILEAKAKITIGDTIAWSGTLQQLDGNSIHFRGASTGLEMILPNEFHVHDKVTGKFVPAEGIFSRSDFSATIAESVHRIDFLRRLSFVGRLAGEGHFFVEKVSQYRPAGKVPTSLEEAIEQQLHIPPVDYARAAAYASMNASLAQDHRPIDRRGLRVVQGDRQRVTEDRACEVEMRRSKIRTVQQEQQQQQ